MIFFIQLYIFFIFLYFFQNNIIILYFLFLLYKTTISNYMCIILNFKFFTSSNILNHELYGFEEFVIASSEHSNNSLIWETFGEVKNS
jgi:hypothetical protein